TSTPNPTATQRRRLATHTPSSPHADPVSASPSPRSSHDDLPSLLEQEARPRPHRLQNMHRHPPRPPHRPPRQDGSTHRRPRPPPPLPGPRRRQRRRDPRPRQRASLRRRLPRPDLPPPLDRPRRPSP